MTARVRIHAAWVTALTFVVAVGILAYVGHERDTNDGNRVAHSSEVMTKIEELLRRVVDAESARRGYLLTGDASFLTTYRDAQADVAPTLADLRRIASDDAEMLARVDAVAPLVRRRLEQLDSSVAAQHARPEDTAGQADFTRNGARMTEALRVAVDSVRAHGLGVLRGRQAVAAASAVATARWIVTLEVLALLFACVVGWMITRNLRRRLLALETLRRSEERYRALAETAQDGIFIVGPDRRFQYVNRYVASLFQRSTESIVGRRHEELFSRAIAEKLGGDVKEVLERGRPMYKEDLLTFSAQPFWASTRLVPLLDATGAVSAVMGITRDLTERKLVEAELDETRERLHAAVNAGKVGLWDWDLRTNAVVYSPEWKRQIGYEDAEIADEFREWESRVHPQDLPRTLANVHEYLRGTEADYEAEFRLRHKNGSFRTIIARGTGVCDASGTRIRLLGTHVDITERAELQRQMEHAQKMESVGRLASGVAHDFNNLLTVINSSAEMLGDAIAAENPVREDLQAIIDAGDRATTLTRQLLTFSRQGVQHMCVVDANELINGLTGILDRVLGEHVKLRVVPSAGPTNVRTDSGQLEQVIVNLAVNARDAMPDGGTVVVEVTEVVLDSTYAESHPSVKPGPHVQISVTDTGTGMDAATCARIFEPFFTTKEEGKGTGLGLSTAYGIVKSSAGSIWVYSELGVGTTFKIYLPCVLEAVVTVDAAAVRKEPASGGHETIIVVEDEPSVRELTARVLTLAGYAVLMASTGPEALEVLRKHAGAVDLVLTDVVMPAMNGPELAARILELHGDIAVVYTSGYTGDTVRLQGGLDGGAEFISKPYSAADLRLRVRKVLDARAPRKAS